MPKRWRIASYDSARVAALGRAAGVPSVVAQLLLGRGICDPDGIRSFLDVKLSGLRDPEELPGCSHAASLLHDAIRAGRRITVYGDYDADGMTATAILLSCLKVLGATADYYIPNRIDEGYGLNHDALRTIAGQGGDVVVTVDCGSTSVSEAETARQLGLTLIITDHHQPHVGAFLRNSQSAVSEQLPYVHGKALEDFRTTLFEVCEDLAQSIPADGEGATHLITVEVHGCRSRPDALQISRTIADSPLVKTAIAGADPNWGRIVSAAGYAGVQFDPSKVTLHLNGLLLYERGAPVDFDPDAVSKSIAADRDTSIVLILEEGKSCARFWTTDLTAEYVRLNADYHT
jgi:hypothetical protein